MTRHNAAPIIVFAIGFLVLIASLIYFLTH
jgi:hypothetical protein